MKLLTEKEKARLALVRQRMSEGVNPYSHLSTLTLGSSVRDKSEVKQPVRLKVVTPQAKHNWKFIDNTPVRPFSDHRCIVCDEALQVTSGIYSKVIQQVITKTIETVLHGNEVKKVISYPVFKTGYSCKECYDSLYSDTYYDSKGNLHRGIEIAHLPRVDSSRIKDYSHHDLNPDKVERKRVTQTFLDHGEESEEEWVIKLPEPIPEPVDVNSYNHFMRRGRK